MRDLETLLNEARTVAYGPRAQMKSYLAAGKKIVGVMPYYCPEELVYAAGMIPFGVWGSDRQANESRRYYPAFICSILHTALEMGLKGELNDLSAIMIPISCDSLKGMGANWEAGVKTVPVINVAYAENRKIRAGVEFTMSQFRKIQHQLEGIAGKEITDADIASAIAVYNENRTALQEFVKAVSERPAIVGALDRSAVIKAGFFMDRKEHTALVKEITAAVNECEAASKGFIRVVTTGILADAKPLLSIFEENGITVAADQIAAESADFGFLTPVTADPVEGMAQRLGNIEGCSVLYDLGKKRADDLIEKVKASNAEAVIWVMTKFCDPEEYDYVPVKRKLDAAGIPVLALEVDRQMENYEQIRSAVEAFREAHS